MMSLYNVIINFDIDDNGEQNGEQPDRVRMYCSGVIAGYLQFAIGVGIVSDFKVINDMTTYDITLKHSLVPAGTQSDVLVNQVVKMIIDIATGANTHIVVNVTDNVYGKRYYDNETRLLAHK